MRPFKQLGELLAGVAALVLVPFHAFLRGLQRKGNR
jgi:hypothetical protein